MGRKPCCDKVGLKRGPWTIEEDRKLMNFVLINGIHCWRTVPKLAGLLRCGKSCRLRWINYLRPDLKRGGFTEAEEDQIIQLHATLGNRWSKIASHFVGRTDNEIKNHWNTRIKKRLRQMGIDPVSHKSIEPIPITKESSASENIENNTPQKDQNEAKELDSDDDLFINYEIFNGRLEVMIEHWLNEDNITLDGHQSSSASLQAESSLNASMSEFSPDQLLEKQCSNSTIIQDDATYLNQWIDDEMDSFFRFSYHPDDYLPQVLL